MNENEFQSPGMWLTFEYYLQHRNRYVLDKQINEFIETLLLTAQSRVEIIQSGKSFYRGRIGSIGKKKRYPFKKEHMLNPSPSKTKDGRVNPKGISYLYLSNTKNTALAETRPWLEEFVSIARVETIKEFKVVNAISKNNWLDLPLPWDTSATKEQKEKRIWWDIDKAFSKPVTNETELDYIASQYLAEIFKDKGYEGIKYRSSLFQDGYNIVLFNPYLVKPKKVKLFRVTKMKYESNEWLKKVAVSDF